MSKSPSLRRIQADIRELAIDPSDRYHAAPLENDMFEWHFTIRGADGTEFEGGIYHGRILLPAEYPFKPPNIMFLTPSGRFETGTKVCLSFSAFHPELWQPAWGIRLILEALISFLPTKGDGAIGALDWTVKERKRLAKESVNFCCIQCGSIKDIMEAVDERVKRNASRNKEGAASKSKFQTEIEQLHALQVEAESERKLKSDEKEGSSAKESDENVEIKNEFSSDNEEPASEPDGIVTNKNDPSKVESVTEPSSDEPTAQRELLLSTERIAAGNNVIDTISENETSQVTDESVIVNPLPVQQSFLDSPWFSDPVSHAGIIIFSILVYMLVKKVQAIMEDLIELEAQFHTV